MRDGVVSALSVRGLSDVARPLNLAAQNGGGVLPSGDSPQMAAVPRFQGTQSRRVFRAAPDQHRPELV